MNQVDALVLVLLTPFALRGYWRGLCREVFGLVGLVGGAALAAAMSPRLGALLVARHLLPDLAARPVAFAAVMALVVIAASLLGMLADRVVRALLLGGINRVAGAFFGLAKGATVCGFLLLLVEHLVPSPALAQTIGSSTLGRPLSQLAAGLLSAGGHPAPAPSRA